jgi:hypothetical protein
MNKKMQQCLVSPPVIRPDIHCTFDVMSLCDKEYAQDPDASDACREGARDAHLLRHRHAASTRGDTSTEGYNAGFETTLRICTPFDEW